MEGTVTGQYGGQDQAPTGPGNPPPQPTARSPPLAYGQSTPHPHPSPMPSNLNTNIYEPEEYAWSAFIQRRLDSPSSSSYLKLSYSPSPSLSPALNSLQLTSHTLSSTLTIYTSPDLYISHTHSPSKQKIQATGSPGLINSLRDLIISANPTPLPPMVEWIWSNDGESTTLPIDNTTHPLPGFYPHLGSETYQSYTDRFINSRSNILLLIGPPGTGKTSLIKAMLSHSGSSSILSYDPHILEKDAIFSQFMSGGHTFMILEDADSFLSSRSKGNTVMHKFLNIGDGILSTKSKKIIFTTNLPSTSDIDPALLRPGRCFDVFRFGKLTPDQARAIVPTHSGTVPLTLAELLNGEGWKPPQTGFRTGGDG